MHNWHFTIGFLISFFSKEYILSSNAYISVNTIFQCCYLFLSWEIGHPLSTCATEGMEGVIQNVNRCIQGRWVSRLMCTNALPNNYSSHVFVLRCLAFTFIKKGCVFLRNGYFLQKDHFLLSWNKLFHFKLFFRIKVNNNAFNFNQIES